MQEFFELLEQGRNLFYAFELTLCLGLWLLTSIGLLSMHALDGALDIHLDKDLPLGGKDLSLDIDTDLSLWDSTLGFMGVGKVPFTIVLTVFMFLHGALGISLNEWIFGQFSFSPFWSGFMVVAHFVMAMILSVFGTSLLTKPLRPLFKDYGEGVKANALVGREASVNTSSVSTQFGQATVKLDSGNVVEISIRTTDDLLPVQYGEKVLIIDFIAEKNIYLVEKTKF